MKILVIRLSSLGDVLLSTYLLRLLRNSFPNAQIDFLVAKEFAIVFKYNIRLNNVLLYDKSKSFASHIVSTLSINNPHHYDIIIDLQNNFRSRVFTWGKGTQIFRFDKRRLYKLRFVYLKKRTSAFKAIPILYAETFPEILLSDDGLGLELWTSKDRPTYLPHSKTPRAFFNKVAIAPGAKHLTKRLPLDKYIELVKLFQSKFGSEIYLVGGKEDTYLCEEISNRAQSVKNYSGRLDVIETAELLDEMGLVVSNDSAVVHIASARKVPVVQVYGSTVPEFGFIPFRTHYAIVENNNVSCRPCTHYGRAACPKNHFRCMMDISPLDIFKAAINLVETPTSEL
jgi:heptosyltransferase-2